MSSTRSFGHAAIATATAELVTLPICTIKTNYQTTSSTSILATCRKLYQEHGLRCFYRASVPSIASQTFSTASKYGLYTMLKERGSLITIQLPWWRNDNLSSSSHLPTWMINLGSGILSGVASSIFTHPMDVFRIYWQRGIKVMPHIKNDGAMATLYRGYSKSLSKVVVGSALFFPLTDAIRGFLVDVNQPSLTSTLLAATASAFISTSIMHPIDYLKTRHIANLPLFEGWSLRPYYKGLSLNLLRIVPHFAIVMCIIELLASNAGESHPTRLAGFSIWASPSRGERCGRLFEPTTLPTSPQK